MAQQLVAIDVSPKCARLVVMEATFRETRVIGAETVPLDATAADELSLWQGIRRRLPPNVDSVIVSADARGASTRLLGFPFADAKKLEPAIGFELENQVPYPLEEAAIAWSVVDKGAGATQVLVATTQREPLAQQIKLLKQVDLEPRVMVIPAAALGELVPHGVSPTPLAVLSLGETQSHLAVLHHGLVFARTLRAGGTNVDRALAKRFGLELAQAKEAKEKEAVLIESAAQATDNQRAVSETVADGLSLLLQSLGTTLRSLPPEHVPQRLLLTGGLSRLPGLPEFLASRLGMPVALLDISEALPPPAVPGPALGPEYALAVALGLAILRRGRNVALNFRQGDLAYHGDIQVYRGEMMRIGLGLAAVFLLAMAGATVRYSLIAAEERQLDRTFCDVTKRITGREICDPTAALATVRSSSGGEGGIVLPPYSATDLFEAFSRLIERDVELTFEDLEFRVNGRPDDPDRITGKGEAATFETTEQLVVRLKKHPCVSDAEASKQRKTRDNTRVEFSFSAKVSCPVGVHPLAVATSGSQSTPVEPARPDVDNPEAGVSLGEER